MNFSDPAFLANYPVLPPPLGQESDFDSPADDAVLLWVFSIGSLTIAAAAVFIRLYVKRIVNRQKITIDDACLVALAFAIAHTCVLLIQLDYGLGKKMWNVRAISITPHRTRVMTSSNLLMATNALFVRLSVLALYHRLFGVFRSSRLLIYIAYALSILIALPEMGIAIGRMVLCSSTTAALTLSYCSTLTTSKALTAFSVAAVFTDIFIFYIAIARVRTLSVERGKKVQLAVVFSAGFIAVGFCIASVIFVGIHFYSTDQLWYALWVAFFKFLEANIALTCACVTFLPAFWKAHMTAVSSITASGQSGPRLQSSSWRSSEAKKPSAAKGRGSDDLLVDTIDLEMHPCRVSSTRTRDSEERAGHGG